MTTPPQKKAQTSAKATLVIVSAVQFLVPFVLSAVGVALPVIGRDLEASAVQLSLIQTAQVLAIAIFLLPVGRFADIYGRKRIFITGITIFLAATLGCALAESIEILIMVRFFQGIGSAMIFSTSVAILTEVVPPGKRGRAMGIVVAMIYIGMASGPSISGFIVEYMGWRWIFLCTSTIILVSLVLTVIRLKGEWTIAQGEPFDWSGTFVFMIALFLVIYGAAGLTKTASAKWFALAGLGGMGLFFILQWRTPYPILNLHLLIDNPAFTFSNLATFINYASSFSFIFFFSLYLQYVKGFSPKYAGLLLVIQPLVQAVLAPVAGRLSDFYPPAYIATIGMGFCTVGLFGAGMIDAGASLALIIFVTVLLGISLGLFSTPNMTAIMECVEPRHVGTASSMVATMRTVGILASTTFIAVIFSIYLGDQQMNSGNIGGFLVSQKTSLYFFSGMSLLGTMFSMVKGRLATSISAGQAAGVQ